MQKLMMLVAGIFLLTGFQASASEDTSDELMEVVNVTYDYQVREETEYYSADIIGSMTVTLQCKGYQYFKAMFTGGHYESEEEAPIYKEWTEFCDPNGEQVTVVFPIITWGSWIKCGYYSKHTQEMVYIPSICSNDYIDPADLDAVQGGVEAVAAVYPYYG